MENGHGTRPLLGAVLIVKDEAKTLDKTLNSVGEWCEVMTIIDTGSTDGTQDIVRQWTKGVVLIEEPFVDYAATRNRALEIAAEKNPTVFSLVMSADETLIGGAELRTFLEEKRDATDGAYLVMMRVGSRQFPFPRILRTGGGWKYQNTAGNLHEQPFGPNGENEAPLSPATVVHAESDPLRKMQRLRERDLPVLTASSEDASTSIAERAEAMFQLAETHFVLGYNEPLEDDGQREVGGRWLDHYFRALGLYTRYAEIAEAIAAQLKSAGDPNHEFLFQKAMYARFMFCYVAETFGLFEPTELVKRLTLIAKCAPNLPEVHWSLAKNAAKVDAKKAIPLAMRAAKAARRVYDSPVHGPVDVTLEWKAYLLASDCARLIKDKKLQHSFAKQALAAGAPREEVGDLAPLEVVQ